MAQNHAGEPWCGGCGVQVRHPLIRPFARLMLQYASPKLLERVARREVRVADAVQQSSTQVPACGFVRHRRSGSRFGAARQPDPSLNSLLSSFACKPSHDLDTSRCAYPANRCCFDGPRGGSQMLLLPWPGASSHVCPLTAQNGKHAKECPIYGAARAIKASYEPGSVRQHGFH